METIDEYRHFDLNAGSADELTWLRIKQNAYSGRYNTVAALQVRTKEEGAEMAIKGGGIHVPLASRFKPRHDMTIKT